MPVASSDYAAAELNGKIYVAIGSYFFWYDTSNDSWSRRSETTFVNELWLAKSNEVIYAIESNWTIHKYNANQNAWTTVN